MLLLLLCWASSCSKPATPLDAGVQIRRSSDVRTALLYAYPEYRNTQVLESSARVTRVIPGLTAEKRDKSLTQMRFEVSDAGRGWNLNKFHLEQIEADTLSLSMSYTAEDLGRLSMAPNGLSSMEMANYLPRDLPIGRELFELEVRYRASPERCLQLVRQAVRLLEANQQWRVTKAPPEWTPDAQSDAELPQNFVVQVTGVDGARISWDRTTDQVKVTYALETVSPKP